MVNRTMASASLNMCLDFLVAVALMKSCAHSRSLMSDWLVCSSLSVKVATSSADEDSVSLSITRKPTAFMVQAT